MTLKSLISKLMRLGLLIVLTIVCLFETDSTPASAKNRHYTSHTNGRACYYCTRSGGRRNQDHGVGALRHYLKKWNAKPNRRYSKAPRKKSNRHYSKGSRKKTTRQPRGNRGGGGGGGSCPQFMDINGDVGPWGEQVLRFIRLPQYRNTYLRTSIPGCSNYRNLSVDERELAWVQFFGQLARVESTCRPSAIHNARIPRRLRGKVQLGIGLFAAEYSKYTRLTVRGRACMGDIRSPSVQIECAVDTLYKTHLNRGGVITNGTGYFHVLNGGMRRYINRSHGISSGMSRYSLCR